MPITGVCPECGCKFQAPDKLLGREVKCPKCAVRIELTPAQEPDAERWCVQSSDGQQHGPVSRKKLDALAAAGRLDSFCRVRAEDSDEWQWAEDLYPELASTAGSQADDEDLAPPEPSRPEPPKPEPRVVRCPDCGKTVSTRADQCPHCGCPASVLQQTPPLVDDSSAVPTSVDGNASWVIPLVIGGVSAAVVLACIVGTVVWWAVKKAGQVQNQVESVVQELVGEEIELPEEPAAPTLEELRAYAREVSATMAKKVDSYYRQAHMATSLISSTKETSELIQALAGGDLDAIPDSVPANESYESQYESLFMECVEYLGENIRADEKDTSKILQAAEKWAETKQAAFDKQLSKQLGLE
jgi:uncharacterized protein DUF4339